MLIDTFPSPDRVVPFEPRDTVDLLDWASAMRGRGVRVATALDKTAAEFLASIGIASDLLVRWRVIRDRSGDIVLIDHDGADHKSFATMRDCLDAVTDMIDAEDAANAPTFVPPEELVAAAHITAASGTPLLL